MTNVIEFPAMSAANRVVVQEALDTFVQALADVTQRPTACTILDVAVASLSTTIKLELQDFAGYVGNKMVDDVGRAMSSMYDRRRIAIRPSAPDDGTCWEYTRWSYTLAGEPHTFAGSIRYSRKDKKCYISLVVWYNQLV